MQGPDPQNITDLADHNLGEQKNNLARLNPGPCSADDTVIPLVGLSLFLLPDGVSQAGMSVLRTSGLPLSSRPVGAGKGWESRFSQGQF